MYTTCNIQPSAWQHKQPTTSPDFSCSQSISATLSHTGSINSFDTGTFEGFKVVYYSRRWTKRVIDHFRHAHFFKMADISDGPISTFKSHKLLYTETDDTACLVKFCFLFDIICSHNKRGICVRFCFALHFSDQVRFRIVSTIFKFRIFDFGIGFRNDTITRWVAECA